MPDGFKFLDAIWPFAFNDAAPNANISGTKEGEVGPAAVGSVVVEILGDPAYDAMTGLLKVQAKVIDVTDNVSVTAGSISFSGISVVVE